MEYDDNWYWPKDGSTSVEAFLLKSKAEDSARALSKARLFGNFRDLWLIGSYNQDELPSKKSKEECEVALTEVGFDIADGKINNTDLTDEQMKVFTEVTGIRLYDVVEVEIENED